MRSLSVLVSILALSLGCLAHASRFTLSCRPYKKDPQQAGAFLNDFSLILSPGVSVTIYQAKLGSGLIVLDHENKIPVVPMPAWDSGLPTHVRKQMAKGTERFSRFHRIFSAEGFSLTADILKPSAGITPVKLYWRSTDDMIVHETYRCEPRSK